MAIRQADAVDMSMQLTFTRPLRRLLSAAAPPRWLGATLVLALCIMVADLAAEWYLTGFGESGFAEPRAGPTLRVHYFRNDLLFLLGVVCLGALPIAVFAALVATRYLRGRILVAVLRTAAVPVILFAALLLSGYLAAEVRRHRLTQAAERMAPLVAAIERHERERGTRPESLDELVPEYLPHVRRFGVRGCFPLRYSRYPGPGNWVLMMECPQALVTLDHFTYHPHAPRLDSSTEMLGGWVYRWD